MKARPQEIKNEAVAYLFIPSREARNGFSVLRTRDSIEKTEFQHSRSVGILVDRSTRDIVIYSIKK